MKRVLFTAAVMILAIVTAAQVTPEEKQIRETYAKIELASEINYVQQALTDKISLPDLLAKNRLEFRLSEFRVGNVSDVQAEPYGHFISRPDGQDSLQITKGTFSLQRGRDAYQSVYATVRWVKNPAVMPVEWESMLLGHVVDAAQRTEGGSIYTRYAAYTVTVTFQGVTQTRKATWFWGNDKTGENVVLAGDHLTGSSALASFLNQPIYPATLLDDRENRNNSVVVEWLRTVAQDCPGNHKDNCYDETTGKAGISRQDIDRGPIVEKQTSVLGDRYSIIARQSCGKRIRLTPRSRGMFS